MQIGLNNSVKTNYSFPAEVNQNNSDLASIPVELIREIFSFLEDKNSLNLMISCKKMYRIGAHFICEQQIANYKAAIQFIKFLDEKYQKITKKMEGLITSMTLIQETPNWKSAVHISQAFINLYEGILEIQENCYPRDISPKDLIVNFKAMKETIIDALSECDWRVVRLLDLTVEEARKWPHALKDILSLAKNRICGRVELVPCKVKIEKAEKWEDFIINNKHLEGDVKLVRTLILSNEGNDRGWSTYHPRLGCFPSRAPAVMFQGKKQYDRVTFKYKGYDIVFYCKNSWNVEFEDLLNKILNSEYNRPFA